MRSAKRRIGVHLFLPVLLVAIIGTGRAPACPFCAAVSQTLAEEMESMDAVVLASLEFAAEYDEESVYEGPLPLSRFRVRQVLKGESFCKPGDEVECTYFGTADEKATYLLMAAAAPTLSWGAPMMLTPRSEEYVLHIVELPTDGSRLTFFLKHLGDSEELIMRDAYDEFARSPYEQVIAIKDHMDRKWLLDRIKDPEVFVDHRRLYLTMLGVCGTESDAEELATLLRSETKEDRAGLNALVAAYLSLAGAKGLPLIEELFLTNEAADYADIHAAIMALRFHGSETDRIPRPEVIRSIRLILERDELADLVIPDLARWEDWSVIPKLVDLFEKADRKANWVRVPVVSYMRACPLPEAKEALKRLEAIDPDSVRRATALFPFQPSSQPPIGEAETEPKEGAAGLDKLPAKTAAAPIPPNPFSASKAISRDEDWLGERQRHDADAAARAGWPGILIRARELSIAWFRYLLAAALILGFGLVVRLQGHREMGPENAQVRHVPAVADLPAESKRLEELSTRT